MVKEESDRIWKWIQDIQATKHEHYCVTENRNIQSELKSRYKSN